MTTNNYIFLYKGESTIPKNGDVVKVNIVLKTITFTRNNTPISLKFWDNIICDKNINAYNAPEIIQSITKLTPVLDTNDSIGDILIFKLSGKTKEDKEVSK